jgi:hypothetical protein
LIFVISKARRIDRFVLVGAPHSRHPMLSQVWVDQPAFQACGATGDLTLRVPPIPGGGERIIKVRKLKAPQGAGERVLRAFVDSDCKLNPIPFLTQVTTTHARVIFICTVAAAIAIAMPNLSLAIRVHVATAGVHGAVCGVADRGPSRDHASKVVPSCRSLLTPTPSLRSRCPDSASPGLTGPRTAGVVLYASVQLHGLLLAGA